MQPGPMQPASYGSQQSPPERWQRPRGRIDPLVLLGGILVFVGYLLFAAAQFDLIQFAPGQVATYFGAGEVTVGTGFLLAFVGLAIRK